MTFVSTASTPTRNPTIYDLYKKPIGSNIPDDLISGSRWISPITRKPYNLQTKKTPSLDFVKREQPSSFIFGGGSKETQADKIAKAHFREMDRRAYEDFLTSSRTYWLTNAPQPPEPLEAEIEKPKVEIPMIEAKKRGRRAGKGSRGNIFTQTPSLEAEVKTEPVVEPAKRRRGRKGSVRNPPVITIMENILQ